MSVDVDVKVKVQVKPEICNGIVNMGISTSRPDLALACPEVNIYIPSFIFSDCSHSYNLACSRDGSVVMLARRCAQLSRRRVLLCLTGLTSGQQRNISGLQTSQFDPSVNPAQTHAREGQVDPSGIFSKASAKSIAARQDRLGFGELSSKTYEESKYDAGTCYAENKAISIALDGGIHKFDPVLLRDLCSCSLCIDQSTRQKLFVTADIPLEIRPSECTTGPETCVVSWANDVPGYDSEHKTEIPLDTIRRIVQSGRPVGRSIANQDLPKRIYWSAQEYSRQCSDFDYYSYMQDDNVLLSALQQLEKYGLLFIHSVPEDEKSVEALAERVGPLKTTFYGRTWDVRSVPEAKNVAYTAQNLGFHMDLLYMEQPPHLQLLHCIRSSSAGGASLFTDSLAAVEALYHQDPDHFRTLSNVKAAFHYDHPGSQYYHQFRSIIEEKPKHVEDFEAATYEHVNRLKTQGLVDQTLYNSPMDFVSAVAWSPPFQAPFALDRDVSPNIGRSTSGRRPWNEVLSQDLHRWHQAAHKFNALIHRPENIYERLMKPGECVIFDNRRVLHARKAFEVGDAGKERWLRGAYIDKDPYLSKLRVLTEQNQEVVG